MLGYTRPPNRLAANLEAPNFEFFSDHWPHGPRRNGGDRARNSISEGRVEAGDDPTLLSACDFQPDDAYRLQLAAGCGPDSVLHRFMSAARDLMLKTLLLRLLL